MYEGFDINQAGVLVNDLNYCALAIDPLTTYNQLFKSRHCPYPFS